MHLEEYPFFTIKTGLVNKLVRGEMEKAQLENHVKEMIALSHQLEGWQTDNEILFLSVLPFYQGIGGELLEIGCFKGKSTIILAKSAIKAGYLKIHACDPHILPFIKQEDLTNLFFTNLRTHSVIENVEFHLMKSLDLSRSWTAPLRILWIDGDHTYDGALTDFRQYRKFLVPGAIVCLHDVLHDEDGPTRVFVEEILLSNSFGDCGICGSIGWGQFLGGHIASQHIWENKLSLYKKISLVIPYITRRSYGVPVGNIRKILFKLFRHFIPHGEIDPYIWLTERKEGDRRVN